MRIKEKIGWNTKWQIDKWHDPTGTVEELSKDGLTIDDLIILYPGNLIDSQVFLGNVALNEGLQQLIDIICGITTPTLWNNGNARVGVGTSNTAANASQTGLLGTTAFASMDGGYPQRSGQVASWKGTFGDGVAEFAWEEFTVDNGAAGDVNLNRYVTSKGTKGSGETWVLTVQITFS
jgi:hypothetical protein